MKELLYELNLQMFATQTTLLNQAGNDLSPEMKTYYHDQLIDNAEPALVYDQFGAKYPIPAHGGKTIEFRKYRPLQKALQPLTEGVTPAGNKLDVSTITSTIQQYGDYIEISDVLEVTAIDRNVVEATKLLGSQAGRTMDTVTREVVCAGTNKLFAPKVNAGNETEVLLRADVDKTAGLTPKVIRKAVAKLKRNNALPYDDSFVAIIHPDVTCDLTGDPEWLEAHKYAKPDEIYNGEIGRLAGVRFVESTEAKIIGPGWLFGSGAGDGICRIKNKTAISSSTTSVFPDMTISAEQKADMDAKIAANGGALPVYLNGVANTITAVTAGAPGTAKFTVGTAVTSLAAGALICGGGAGKDGSAIYCTVIIGANAYGTTEVSGLGLQHIVKQLGSAGTGDPLNQRSTTGWKATKTAERLVEEYMIRVEHSSASFGDSAESN